MRIILCLLLLLFSTNSFSGVIRKTVFSGISVITIEQVIKQAIIKGSPTAINNAIKIVRQVNKTGAGQKYLYSMLSFYVITDRTSEQARNAGAIIIGSGMDNMSFKKKISQDMDMFDSHVVTLSHIASQIEKENKIQCVNKNLIYQNNPNIYIRSVNLPVKEWDYGSYNELTKNAIKLDMMEHDHIPSIKAVLLYLEKRDKNPKLSRKKDTGLIINNNATAIEIKKTLHVKGRTFGGKNNDDLAEKDSLNLKVATIKDIAYYSIGNKKISSIMLQSFVNIFSRNLYLCLYEK